MTRRARLPGTEQLFGPAASSERPHEPAAVSRHAVPPPRQPRRGSGRERHDEKITVYLSPDELVALERARLALHERHGVKVDRGRIVREAVAAALSELETKGEAATLVRRLRGR